MRGKPRRLLAIFLVLALLCTDICAIAEAAATLTLPSALQIIDEETFYGNTSIEKVIVPDGTTEIRSNAFAYSSITELFLPDTLTFIAENAFAGCGEFALTVPENCYAYDRCVELGLIKQEEPDPSVIESAHPYPDDFDYTWTYDAGEGTESITITFSADTETEKGHDFICLYTLGGMEAGKYSGAELAGQSVTISGTGFKLRLVSDEARESSNTYYGFKLDSIIPKAEDPLAFESITAESASVAPGETIRWAVETTGGKAPVYYDYTVLLGAEKVAGGTAEAPEAIEYMPIRAGEYKLSVTARDSGAAMLPAQVSEGVVVVPSASYPESEHPYAANTDQRWVYAAEEHVERLNVTFSKETYTQRGYDFIYLYDQYGSQIGRYNYTELAGKTFEIPGSAFTIRLTTNAVVHHYGFSITNIEKIHSGPLAFISLAADKTQVKAGDLITWVMESAGGERPVTHEYTIMLNGEEVFSDYVIRPEAIEYVPMLPGDYTISVVARDGQGNTLPAQTGAFSVTERDVTAEEAFTYTVINDTQARITGYTGADAAVIVPETLGGYEVAEIGSGAFRDEAGLVSISLPDTVTAVAADAFNNCDALRSVELGQNVTSVGARAFYDCDALRAFSFPDSVTTTGAGVLRQCDSLAYVDFSTSWTSAKESIIADCPRLTKIMLPEGMTAVPEQAFRSCTNLQEVSLPSTLQFIRESAFHGCTSLRQIDLPAKLEGIHKFAFRETALTAINVPASVTYLTGFYGCRQLTDVRLHEGLTEIGSNAFDGCTSLAEVDIPEGVRVVSSYAFNNCQSLKAIELPDSVTSIGEFCFNNCLSLESFHYPLSMNAVVCDTGAVRNGAIFKDCSRLESITVPEGITFIPEFFFRGANCLKRVTLPSTLETISSGAFENCTAVESMAFPAGLRVIRPNAFAGCAALTAADLPDTVTEIGEHAFDGCVNLESFHYPLSLNAVACDTGFMHDGAIFKDCAKLESITVPEGVTFIPKFFFRGANCLKHVTLPSTLEAISSGAFENCTSIERMQFPDGLKMIRPSAFAGCTALISADLPDTVTGIGENAFDGCVNLQSFRYPLGLDQVLTDAGWVHFGEVLKNCPKLTSVTIPEGVTHIPGFFFRNSAYLQYVSIPSTLTTIGSRAFENCSAFIQTYISPNVTSVGEDVFANCDQLTVWCEYGSTILAYCQENAVGYYYLTPDGANPPSGTLYEGEYYGLYGYARSSLPLTNVTATIWNSDKSAVIQTISVSPGETDYPLSGAINNHLTFHELPLGNYRYTMTASTELSTETWADTSFKIVELPLWISISNFTVPKNLVDSMTGALQFSGRLLANYMMTSVTAELVGTDGAIVASDTAVPNSKSFELSNLRLNIQGIANGSYTLQIHASAKGETQCVAQYTFNIGNSVNVAPVTDKLRSEVLEYLQNRKAGTFNPGTRVEEHFGNLDTRDFVLMALSDYTNIGLSKIGDWLTGSDYDTYMKAKYEAEIAQLLDDMYKTGQVLTFPLDTGVAEMLKSFTTIYEKFDEDAYDGIAREIVIFAAKHKLSIPYETYMMLQQLSTEIETMGAILEGVEIAEDVFDVLRDLLTDHSRALEALDTIAEIYNQSGDPNFTAALQTLRRNYQTQYGQALHTAFGKITEEMRKNTGKILTKALFTKSVSGLYTLVDTACQLFLKLSGLEKIGNNNYQFVTQYTTLQTLQQTFSTACTEALTAYYENGTLPTDQQISKIQLTFISTRQALIRLYQTMCSVDAKHKAEYERLIDQAEDLIMPGVPPVL